MNNLWDSYRFWSSRKTFEKRRPEIYGQIAFALKHDANVLSELQNMVKTAKFRQSDMLPIYQRWLNNYKGEAAGHLSLSMKNSVSDAECSLIASAEETQKLADGFEFLAESTKQISEMEQAIKKAVRSIFLPASMLVGLLYSIDAYFFPIVTESIPPSEWGPIATFVAGLAHNISSVIVAGVIVFPAAFICWKRSLPKWKGNGRLIAEKTMLYSKYRDFNCAVFLVNLAFLMKAGKPPRAALITIKKNASPFIKWHLENMLAKMEVGSSNMGHVLVSTGLFSQELGDLLTNYARWTDWHTEIENIAYTALNKVTKDVLEMSPKIQEGLKAVVGIVVFLVLATVGTIVMTLMKVSGYK